MESLTIITKRSILDVAAVLDLPLNKTKYLKHVQIGSMIEVSLKKKRFIIFSLSKKINDSIHRFRKYAVCIRPFNVNYSNTAPSGLSHCAT